MSKLVLSLCDESAVAVQPWADAGYRCVCVDLQPRESNHPNIEHVRADVRHWLPPKEDFAIVMAWPPCTNLAVSGARWFADKGLRGLIEGLELVEACRAICEWSGAPWLLENPVGTLSTYWRKPDHRFDPCDFGDYLDPPGDAYTKRTCLWTGGGFVMPEPKPVVPVNGSKMHRLPPSEDRARLRSETPRGFAQAVFEANAVLSGTNTGEGHGGAANCALVALASDAGLVELGGRAGAGALVLRATSCDAWPTDSSTPR